MLGLATQSHGCSCCLNRRRFLAAAGCGLCAAALPSASASAGAPVNNPRVRLLFACWARKQDRPTWPHIGYDLAPQMALVASTLKKSCPNVELLVDEVHGVEDVRRLMARDEADRIDGYIVYQMNNWIEVVKPVAASGKPTLFADFLFAGSGGFLVYTSELRREQKNISMVSSSRLEDLAAAVKCFEIIGRGGTTAEFVAACDRVRRERTPAAADAACKDAPLKLADIGRCLEDMKQAKMLVIGGWKKFSKEIQESLGIQVIHTDFTELAAAQEAADADQAREIAARWKSAANKVELDDAVGTLELSARNYLAQQAVMKKHGAEAITINCLGGFGSGNLKAYPCLGFVEMFNSGLTGACEGDLLSTATLMTMRHLTGRPGYISDPVIDTSKRQIIYAHCVASTKMFGPQGESNPYEILTHSEDRRGASVRSFLPLGYMTTSIKIHPGRREVLCHRAKAVENVVSDLACRTKLAAEVQGDMEKLFNYWDQYSWHRVTFYGDLWEPAKELAAALKFKFVAEA